MNARRTRGRAVRLALSATLAALIGTTPVAAHAPDPVFSGALWAQDQDVRFRWRAGQEPPAFMQAPIKAAAADSNATRQARAALFSHDPAGASWISYGLNVGCGVNGIACFSRVNAPDSFSMSFREQGHAFDWGTLKWCQWYDVAPNGCFDVENIALDEFGHAQILNHHVNFADDSDYGDAVVQTFSRAKPKVYWNVHAYGPCDTGPLQLRYGVPGTHTRISTCLDLRTQLTLGASSTSLPWSGSVIFTSRLSVPDLDEYRRLGGLALSARTVVIQRRAPGATTWTTVATMAVAGTGTYSHTAVSQQATMDWRTVFQPGNDDGVRPATSPVVRVWVSACKTQCPVSVGTGADR